MNAQEASLAVGVTERTVRRWITEGKLPAVKRSAREFEISESDLLDWNAERQMRQSASGESLASVAREVWRMGVPEAGMVMIPVDVYVRLGQILGVPEWASRAKVDG